MKQIAIIFIFFSILLGQFGKVRVVFDDKLLKINERQTVLPLQDEIRRFIKTTQWDEDYSDLKIPLHIQFIFEGAAQKGSQETFLAQILITNGTDQRFFDKSVQFPYGQGGQIYFDLVQFDPLSGFLAFYTNLILAGEMDTYEPMGGTLTYEICREIALRGTASDYSRGWSDRIKKADDLSSNFGLRKAKFSYYYAMELFRDGDIDIAVNEFKNMIKGLDEVYDRSPREHYTMIFLKAHARELSRVLHLLGQKDMLQDMMALDPDNLELYKSSYKKR